ncbi:MAG: urate hydroxylase PuuD [Terrimicrobiaceae bacterium]
MESDLVGWVSVIFRFVHVLAAIMWIGNSLLFTWMEMNLIKPASSDDGNPLLGTLDMLHGGGVYHLEKRVLKAGAIPEPLHWFMWQSYTTWLTGFVLLLALYHPGAGSFFVDPTKTSLPGWSAILLSLSGIFGGWLVYDRLWLSPLRKHVRIAIPLSLALLITAAVFYNQIFNGRAVYLQIGAMMGTMMSANVFFRIIANQKRFMTALQAGKPHDLELGKKAKERSLHNHYMTFPVLFLMLSAHFPQLTAAAWNIPILAVIVVSLMFIKYLMNARYHFSDWLPCVGGAFFFSTATIFVFLALPNVMESSSSPEQRRIATGRQLFLGTGCGTCHMQGSAGLAPDLHGVSGKPQTMSDGAVVIADAGYLREAILTPHLKIVKGYPAVMPAYAEQFTESQVDSLVAYVQSIGSTP